jgi:hypothetical protein
MEYFLASFAADGQSASGIGNPCGLREFSARHALRGLQDAAE